MTIDDSGLLAYDIDPVTGFLPRETPIERLPPQWEIWEKTLDSALALKLNVGQKYDITPDAVKRAAGWRESVRKVCYILTCCARRHSGTNAFWYGGVLSCQYFPLRI